jgi:GrpB-like predicted nucleotidyltransferase (UPF0157 family)
MALTDEQINAATIGGRARHDGPIELVDYDPSWPQVYRGEEAAIRGALGDRVRAVEHVGSTAVPGLAAKAIIDIVLAVADSTDEAAYVPPLEAVGYTLRRREPADHEHRLFRKLGPRVNLHVYADGCPEIERYLRFRDRLRAAPEERELYERTKRELAQRTWEYAQHYADAKTEVVEAILARAR